MNVSSADPDDARRKKLLNTLLFYMSLGGAIVLLIGLVTIFLNPSELQGSLLLFYGMGVFLLVNTLIYVLNKRRGRAAAWLFLVILNLVVAVSDVPEKVGNGSSMFVFAIPIATAALLLRPASSFVFALLSAAIVIVLGMTNDFIPNIPTIASFFVLALVSWLSASGLERALSDVRAINLNLDRLVQERTKELASALARERIEAGRSKAILESIADGVIVFDLQGAAIIANPSTIGLLDIPHEQILGSNIDDLTQAKALDARSRGLLAGLLSSPGQELTSYHIQWGRKTLSVTAARVNDIEGTPLGIVAVFRDYTREAEVERMKNTFLAIVSHELRTPLNAILGYAEMLKEAVYGAVNEKQVRASERIMTNSRRLLDIVSDLLDQAQMEAGKLTIHLRPFRPTDLVENVRGVMEKISADKGLSLTSQLDPTLPEFINGDIARLQQILVNLINNAVKFTDRGSVNMSIYRADRKCWKLEVSDSGIGIPENELPNIFEAFRQVDSSVTRKHGGFGLGLAIVKQLSELMGGEVVVTSTLGAGSTFTVTLPLIPARRTLDERTSDGD
jgi:PAS domain S-box-containing protein